MKNTIKKIAFAATMLLMLVPAFSKEAKGKGTVLSISKPKTNNTIAINFYNTLLEDFTRYTKFIIVEGQDEKAKIKLTGSFKAPDQGRGYSINFKIVNPSNGQVFSSYTNGNVRPFAMQNGNAAHETAYNLLANLGIRFNDAEMEELKMFGVNVRESSREEKDDAPQAAETASSVSVGSSSAVAATSAAISESSSASGIAARKSIESFEDIIPIVDPYIELNLAEMYANEESIRKSQFNSLGIKERAEAYKTMAAFWTALRKAIDSYIEAECPIIVYDVAELKDTINGSKVDFKTAKGVKIFSNPFVNEVYTYYVEKWQEISSDAENKTWKNDVSGFVTTNRSYTLKFGLYDSATKRKMAESRENLYCSVRNYPNKVFPTEMQLYNNNKFYAVSFGGIDIATLPDSYHVEIISVESNKSTVYSDSEFLSLYK